MNRRTRKSGQPGRPVLIWVVAVAWAAAWAAGAWAQAGPEAPGEISAGRPPGPGEEALPPPAAGALAPLFAEPAPEPSLNLGWELVKTGLALILVAGLIVFGLKAGLRLSPWGRKAGSGRFRLEGVMPLDNRKYLAAVDVDGRRLILGITPERVNLLASWADGRPEPEPAPGQEEQLDQD